MYKLAWTCEDRGSPARGPLGVSWGMGRSREPRLSVRGARQALYRGRARVRSRVGTGAGETSPSVHVDVATDARTGGPRLSPCYV